MFDALIVTKDDEGKTSAAITQISTDDLPAGEVLVSVEYTTVNYKDGLCMSSGGGGLVRNYPHVPGIDFAGTVEESSDDRYKAGDKVVLTGWRVGEAHWGGYAQKARVWCHCPAVWTHVRRWPWAPRALPRCCRSWRWKIMASRTAPCWSRVLRGA